MRYLVVTPTERECRNMLRALEGRTEMVNSYSVVRTGVGKALAAASTAQALVRAKGEIDRVAVIGYAASTSDRQRPVPTPIGRSEPIRRIILANGCGHRLLPP